MKQILDAVAGGAGQTTGPPWYAHRFGARLRLQGPGGTAAELGHNGRCATAVACQEEEPGLLSRNLN